MQFKNWSFAYIFLIVYYLFLISVPNDEDYNLEPNNISVNIETNNYKMFRGKIGLPIAISGHIDAKWGQRIVCDLIKFL